MAIKHRLLFLVTILISIFGRITEQKKICDGFLDTDELKSKFFCDAVLTKALIDTNEMVKKTNKYLSHKIDSVLEDIREKCISLYTEPQITVPCGQRQTINSCEDAKTNGIYLIESPSPNVEPFMAYCTRDDEGKAWTVIQRRRGNGSSFHSDDYIDYQRGFGDLLNDFWIGLDKIYALTYRGPMQLWIKLVNLDDEVFTAEYDMFGIGSEKDKYLLQVLGSFSGNATDMLRPHLGYRFSTNKYYNENNLKDKTGGWWFKESDSCNLNGYHYRSSTKKTKRKSKDAFWGKTPFPIRYIRMALREMP